jgi:hypothetical protein
MYYIQTQCYVYFKVESVFNLIQFNPKLNIYTDDTDKRGH